MRIVEIMRTACELRMAFCDQVCDELGMGVCDWGQLVVGTGCIKPSKSSEGGQENKDLWYQRVVEELESKSIPPPPPKGIVQWWLFPWSFISDTFECLALLISIILSLTHLFVEPRVMTLLWRGVYNLSFLVLFWCPQRRYPNINLFNPWQN